MEDKGGWFINIETLEEFNEFVKGLDRRQVVVYEGEHSLVIEIYDSWRE